MLSSWHRIKWKDMFLGYIKRKQKHPQRRWRGLTFTLVSFSMSVNDFHLCRLRALTQRHNTKNTIYKKILSTWIALLKHWFSLCDKYFCVAAIVFFLGALKSTAFIFAAERCADITNFATQSENNLLCPPY